MEYCAVPDFSLTDIVNPGEILMYTWMYIYIYICIYIFAYMLCCLPSALFNYLSDIHVVHDTVLNECCS